MKLRRLTDLPLVRPRTRKAMIAFLSAHYRHHTMNSWNQATSYAVRIKVRCLNLTNDETSRVYEAMDIDHCFFASGFNQILHEFDVAHQHCWQIGTNGRSGGYCVLYQGGSKDSGYKSRCEDCDQLNYQEAKPEPAKCGRCNEMSRYNLKAPVMSIFTYPGKGLGMDDDFADWDTSCLRSRVNLVWSFDLAVERACHAFLAWATSHKPTKKTIMVPKEIIIATPR